MTCFLCKDKQPNQNIFTKNLQLCLTNSLLTAKMTKYMARFMPVRFENSEKGVFRNAKKKIARRSARERDGVYFDSLRHFWWRRGQCNSGR